MYWLFRLKGWKPSDYYWLPSGEKRIIQDFLELEIEQRNKENSPD